MAVDPLYNSRADVLSKLRMSGSSDTDTLAVIDQVIRDVRLGFYHRLTATRALTIAAYSSSDNPTTSEQILRATAETAEVYWIIYKLICILPTMFIETQYAIQNSFDDVPITRDSESLQKYRDSLKKSVEEGISQLEDPPLDEDYSGDFKVFSTRRTDSDGVADPYLLKDEGVGLPGFEW